MSIIKSIKQVLGLGPAAENHHWDGSVPNELSLKRGTPEAPGTEVLKVVDGKITAMASAQTWQNVLGSRVIGTTYINNTGRDIEICVQVSSSVANARPVVTVDGVLAGTGNTQSSANVGAACVTRIPPNASYVVTVTGGGTNTLNAWTELR